MGLYKLQEYFKALLKCHDELVEAFIPYVIFQAGMYIELLVTT